MGVYYPGANIYLAVDVKMLILYRYIVLFSEKRLRINTKK